MLAGYTVSVPNCLSAGPDQLERLYRAVAAAPAAAMYTLNLRAVSFVWPWGVVGLVLGARVTPHGARSGTSASVWPIRSSPGIRRAGAPQRLTGQSRRTPNST